MRHSTVFLLMLLAGCRHSTPPPTEVRPVKTVVATPATTLERDFAGMATPADAVNLAFKLAGQVLDVPVSQGQSVRQGELLAELNPRDVELQIAADRSAYEEARAQQQRMQRLLEHEAVSRQQAEAAATRFAQARSVYENRLEELAQTKIHAPFAGVIEKTYVDNFERVTAGQTVVRLVAPRTTTVKFTMPESALKILGDSSTRFSVQFDNYRGTVFTARLKDYARTSSDASGFPVALRLTDVDTARYDISPGMSCTITVHQRDTIRGAVALPLSAIYAPAEGGTFVWIVGTDSRVQRHAVTLGEVFGRSSIVIDSGVTAGDRVVTAGVNHLSEGERVKVIGQTP